MHCHEATLEKRMEPKAAFASAPQAAAFEALVAAAECVFAAASQSAALASAASEAPSAVAEFQLAAAAGCNCCMIAGRLRLEASS